MTKTQFILECNEVLIDPLIALENQKIVKALNEKKDQEVIELLKTEF